MSGGVNSECLCCHNSERDYHHCGSTDHEFDRATNRFQFVDECELFDDRQVQSADFRLEPSDHSVLGRLSQHCLIRVGLHQEIGSTHPVSRQVGLLHSSTAR